MTAAIYSSSFLPLLFGIRCFHKPLRLFVASTTLTLCPYFFPLFFLHVCANKLKAAARRRGGKKDKRATGWRAPPESCGIRSIFHLNSKICFHRVPSWISNRRPSCFGERAAFGVPGHRSARNALWDQETGTKAQNICCELSLQRKRAERETAPRLRPDE